MFCCIVCHLLNEIEMSSVQASYLASRKRFDYFEMRMFVAFMYWLPKLSISY